jgi:hypothetical protein
MLYRTVTAGVVEQTGKEIKVKYSKAIPVTGRGGL